MSAAIVSNQALSPLQPNADDQLLDAFARRVTGDGASTLDMLKRLDPKQQQCHHAGDVRAEMLLQASAGLNVQHRRATGQPVQNTTTLGERLGRPKERIVPGTPVTRKLRYGRLVRTDGKDDALFASRSAPVLPHPRRVLHDQLCTEALLADTSSNSAKDALDLALSAALAPTSSSNAHQPVSDTGEKARLAQRRNKLEAELLHVTKKLNRKYAKQLFPPRAVSPSKLHSLAAKWADTEHEPSERERYDMYMQGRFTTQAQLDYYERDLEPRDAASSRHRHNAAHTKYGDALVMNRHSLRGTF